MSPPTRPLFLQRVLADAGLDRVRVVVHRQYKGVCDYDSNTIYVPPLHGPVAWKIFFHEVAHLKRGPIEPIWWGEVLADLDALVLMRRYGFEVTDAVIRRILRYSVKKIAQAVKRGYRGPVPPFLAPYVKAAVRNGYAEWARTIRRGRLPASDYFAAARAVHSTGKFPAGTPNEGRF